LRKTIERHRQVWDDLALDSRVTEFRLTSTLPHKHKSELAHEVRHFPSIVLIDAVYEEAGQVSLPTKFGASRQDTCRSPVMMKRTLAIDENDIRFRQALEMVLAPPVITKSDRMPEIQAVGGTEFADLLHNDVTAMVEA
jgi:hypothetical protein